MSHDVPPEDKELDAADGGTSTDSAPTAKDSKPVRLSRRELFKIGGVAAVAGAVPATGLLLAKTESEAAEAGASASGLSGPAPVPMTLTVNGKKESLSLEPRVTLLSALRNHLDLTGAKQVCDRGQCGACTVLLDGKPVMSCMTLAITAQNRNIETVEGLARGDTLHPVQEEFIAHDALMCGFCTPGFVMSIKALLDRNANPTLDEVKAACQGNICRCGTYPKVFEAALAAAKRKKA